jgi:FixJ family two-component response regulator
MLLMSDRKETVAVVDDDPEMRAAMASLLSAFEYCAETFDSAETFLNCASACKAVCLIVDIQLGGLSGLELAQKLAAGGYSFPIVFMTGLGDADLHDRATAAGGVTLLRKPFHPQMLLEAIRRAVN